MDAARNVLRGAGTTNPVKDAGAAAATAASMPSFLPADMAEVQKLSAEAQHMAIDALQNAAAATETWTKTLMSQVQDSQLLHRAPPCRAYGPLERDIANLYEATLTHRRVAGQEASGLVKAFDRRLEGYDAGLTRASGCLKTSEENFEAIQKLSGSVDKVNGSVKGACKKIQEMLECEQQCEQQREKARADRLEKAEEERKAFTAAINEKRERIAQEFKDAEEKLYEDHKKAEQTEDYV
uniref:Biogenesis of lysosome-related organelles complex 1 subunit 5 n=1 Tax=Hemiselmis andersenii TaxID=464988 RepID=A0A6U4NWC8_HEMAN|mmetsp:Transcript_33044/g.77295  ORF Transcript_33044/g.77295 Transcript_33044/m.77295 type:complete len:239 (+) Transcript_33044:100-816(+)